mgnify:CR=1 FL=1
MEQRPGCRNFLKVPRHVVIAGFQRVPETQHEKQYRVSKLRMRLCILVVLRASCQACEGYAFVVITVESKIGLVAIRRIRMEQKIHALS